MINADVTPADRGRFLHSEAGVQAALGAYAVFSSSLEESAKRIGLVFQSANEFRVVGGLGKIYLVCGFAVWNPASLAGAYLLISIYDGFPDVPGFDVSYGPGRQLSAACFEYQLDGGGGHKWVAVDGAEEDLGPDQLATYAVGAYSAATSVHEA